jgi:hypothetical protein
MSTRRIRTANNTTIYIIAIIAIVIAFLLLGGAPWVRGIVHGDMGIHTYSWNWTQILISLGIGFLLGWLVARR